MVHDVRPCLRPSPRGISFGSGGEAVMGPILGWRGSRNAGRCAAASPEICFDAALFPANITPQVAAFPITTLSVVNTAPWEGAYLEMICMFDSRFLSPC